MRMRLIACLLALGLAGCPSVRQPATMTVADACNSYANALDQLTPLKKAGKLSASQLHSVDVANALADPVCRSPVPPTDVASAASLVVQETQVILSITGVIK